jgi:hypothetical protein
MMLLHAGEGVGSLMAGAKEQRTAFDIIPNSFLILSMQQQLKY